MKKFFVIGNPINHSLSPELHNYWLKENNINAIYEKKLMVTNDLKKLCDDIKERKIDGVNVTVPFKNIIINNLDNLTLEAKKTQSVNTIFLKNDQLIGHNTDIDGFELAIKDSKFELKDKKVLILGAGGVVSSIVFALNKMGVNEIMVSNRTKEKAENLNKLFKDIKIINWGEIPRFDMIINATSVGLSKNDKIDLDFSKIQGEKLFYDIIYNPKETEFLRTGKRLGNKTENGKKMFIYQAAAAFKIWHGTQPEINEKVSNILD